MPLGENKDSELPAATGEKAMVAMVTGPNLQPPPHFDFENPAAWQRWREQFDDYSFAAVLHVADDEVRVKTLLYCIGTRDPAKLSPDLLRPDVVFQKDAVAKKRRTRDFNHRHGARELRDLSSVNEVWEEPSHGQQHDMTTGADPDSIPHQVTRSGRRVVPSKKLNL
ncbi:hypothetical protein MRX96_022328 [Rhipicephalus microplus]